jgi:C_GCAxxG_C_C family probable redox protein
MVKDKLTTAMEMFTSGFHCSQSVFAAFSDELGLSRETALKIACPFGGGLGGYGKTCGALTGAMMVLGLKYGSSDIADVESKTKSKEKTRQLIEHFENTHSSSNCNDLVGFDRSHMLGDALKDKLPEFHSKCPKYLETVITFLEGEL